MSESSQSDLGDRSLLDRLLRRVRPSSDLAGWEGTNYPATLAATALLVRDTDGTEISRMARKAFAKAREFMEAERSARAVDELERAAALFTLTDDSHSLAVAVGNMGALYEQLGLPIAAISAWHQALALKHRLLAGPNELGRCYYRLGVALGRAGDFDEAAHALLESERRYEIGGSSSGADEARALREQMEGCGALSIRLRNEVTDDEESVDVHMARAEAFLDANPRGAALEMHAAVVGARQGGYAAIEQDLAFRLARILDKNCMMFRDALRWYAFVAKLAAKRTAASQSFEADLGAGHMAVECGDCNAANLHLQRALSNSAASTLPSLAIQARGLLALTQLRDGQFAHALEQLAPTLDLLRVSGFSREAVSSIVATASLLVHQGFETIAKDLLKGASELGAAGSIEVERLLQIRHRLALLYYSLGEMQPALRELRINRSAAQSSAGQIDALAGTLVGIAQASLELGDFAGAASAFEDLVAIPSPDPSVRIQMSDIAGGLLQLRNRAQVEPDLHKVLTEPPGSPVVRNAIEWFQEELRRAELDPLTASLDRDASAQPRVPELCRVLAALVDHAGSPQDARAILEKGLREAEKLRDWGAVGRILHQQGVTDAKQGRWDEAVLAFGAALRTKDQRDGGQQRETSLICLARAMAYSDVPIDIDPEDCERSLASIDPEAQAVAMFGLATFYERSGRPADAERLLNSVRSLALQRTDSGLTAWTDLLASRLAFAAGRSADAVERAFDARAACERFSHRVDPIQRRSMRQVSEKATSLIVRMALVSQPPRIGEAIAAIERVKARSLVECLGLSVWDSPSDFPDDLRNAERQLLETRRYESRRWNLGFGPADSGALLASDDALVDFWASLPPPWAAYGHARAAVPLDSGEIAMVVADSLRSHVVMLWPVSDRTVVIHLDSSGAIRSTHDCAMGRSELERSVQALNASITEGRPLPDDLRTFGRRLFGELLRDIPPGQGLTIVPGGPLLLCPFTALEFDGQPLIARHPLSLLPAITVASILGARPVGTPGGALVVGDSLNNLRAARSEARAVAAKLRTLPVLGADATRHNIQGVIGQANLIHVAGHGRFDDADPDRAGFFVADGTMFSARDLLQLRLQASLAVLSGCETGVNAVVSGDEISGVGPALLYCGVRTVVASNWRVSDRPTRELMEHFYGGVLGNASVADALQAAQLALATSGSDPKDWAPFQCWGLGHTTRLPGPDQMAVGGT